MINAALPADLTAQSANLLARLQAAGLTIATAESCTGGLIGAVLTAIAGSSASVLAGYITYSNDAKIRMLGVPAETIATAGAVSEACARAMAEGARDDSGADLAVSCTGIAGPGGGSADKPVGLVYIGLARRGMPTQVQRHVFPGNRDEVRHATVAAALSLVQETVAA